ncbi:Crp/Fnr family transcriptional regulator [Arthrobacter cryoconiti]|uniref:Crp/Fnr family transcriptional regulator n=1 Tax=Arthrobacter cryoconiti TaxID=748907 RepID=A0ABV8R2T2_9MICC|nr:Crp/Fnr family transcriptional regulator [Arthrobacter cryoconiti]MCC9067066.1 Crp/Fnr family transcriptional regulator [Arthrobacter cryoconiti]
MNRSKLPAEESELAFEVEGTYAHRRHIPLHSTCAQPHHCPKPLRMQVLARVPVFAGLSKDELDSIDQRTVSLAWSERELLYTAGEPADYVYVLAAGQAKIFQPAPNGQDTIVDILAPGDLFGGLSILGEPRYAETAQALVTTCALRMNTRAFRKVLLEHPTVALRLLDNVSALLGAARSQVSQQGGTPVVARVATTLLRLAEKFGQPGASGDGTLIQLPLSRADLAGLTGSTPESVSRVMSQLRKDGIIDSGRRWTSVLDPDRLAAILETQP